MNKYRMPGEESNHARPLWPIAYLIAHDAFATCPLLPVRDFISLCKDREVEVNEEQLERFERLGIFYPSARKDGTWVPVAYADLGAAEKVFRHLVLSFMHKRGLIDEERVRFTRARGRGRIGGTGDRSGSRSEAAPAGA